MKSTLVLIALSISLAYSAPTQCGPPPPGTVSVGKALYLITNENQNAVVALPIAADGTIGQGTQTLTGGAGSVALDATGNPATPDALISQSSLKVAGNVSFQDTFIARAVTNFESRTSLQSMLALIRFQCSQSDKIRPLCASLANPLRFLAIFLILSQHRRPTTSPASGLQALKRESLAPHSLSKDSVRWTDCDLLI
jgi:hypothetical protein